MTTTQAPPNPVSPAALPPPVRHRPHLPKDRRRLIAAPVILLIVAAALWFLGDRWFNLAGPARLQATGTLEAVELTVASEVAGRVTAVLVNEGDAVKADDPIVRLDSAYPELQYRLASPTERQLLALQLEKYTLKAPRDGRVLRRAVQPGEVVVPGAGLLTIADVGNLELTVYVLQRDLGTIQVGGPVVIQAEALPDAAFRGEVASVAEKAEFTPRNAQTAKDRLNLVFAVKVRLTTPDARLKPGMSVLARFAD